MGNEKLISVTEAAGILALSRVSVLRLIHKGSIKAFRFGNVFRIRESDLTAYINSKAT